ncbi:MAG TPA: hypothetical protein DCY48_03045 [Candidatus Magasanikbacteria bacterium]|nr:MAG: hypothetical protein A3I74_05205 [Candidatus Magasanikbacteria bacterium RIFCSPLOWO2_02_FULL_47_16]OGH79413.1 MAG: hypothetical protein A3C10_05040 [Candidatus Magasanikbacteria bacterium RIFCSPHIGHO2_02_FULL_48_18]OGH83104.1 MAG: hypothetical protein A3G08_01750 [Candidatus Magasanikbacteria bacterium RIFCSPLOWO2_12_FULL_47_9b]HAZ28726.1 hypothetical protein [Candidatus Magasanikbacteria bacterium]
MAARVPAYQDFLHKHGVDATKIQTREDFVHLPLTSKENYLLSYELKDLCWDGVFAGRSWMISSTSGSTGEPFYFPRTIMQDEQFAFTAEICLREYFEIDKKTTLFIDCFALGVWIGGMFMYQAVRLIANTGKYQLSIITPGADKIETLKAIKKNGSQFGQIIIGGYGPLVKDLIDMGRQYGIEWNEYDVKYFFAAEGFTEGFRDYIIRHGGVKHPLSGTINHYGTADLGTMAHETPISILLRRLAVGDSALFQGLFLEANRQPTLGQFIPELFFFESVNNVLVCSGAGGFPLMRYNLKDRGDVVTWEEMQERTGRQGVHLLEKAQAEGIDRFLWHLPFVYLYERSDLTTSIYSVNIYPESIRKALEHEELTTHVTGKFTMSVEFDEHQDQRLYIHIELQPHATESELLRARALDSIVVWLNKENSEWRDFYVDPSIQHKVTPQLVFWPHQHSTYFQPGRKQKWVKEN